MVLSYKSYKSKNDLLKDFNEEIRHHYNVCDYDDDDKFQVVCHRVIDSFVSFISIHDLKNYLNFFSYDNIKNIDSGLLPEQISNPEKYDRCLLFCLIEQEIWVLQ